MRVLFLLPLLALAGLPVHARQEKSITVPLVVRETAGIRRFGYPVHVHLPLPEGKGQRHRLLAAGKPVAAQFTPDSAGKGVWLDFNTSMGPLEKQSFQIEYGLSVPTTPENKGGLRLVESKDAFTIQSGDMSYRVNRDLQGLLAEVKGGKRNYLATGRKSGLQVKTARGLSGLSGEVKVLRQGPLAVALGCTCSLEGKAPVTVELLFPRSKSWVQVDVSSRDADGELVACQAELPLEMSTTPTLVDFGASTIVYTTLVKNETAALLAGSEVKTGWEVQRNRASFVLPPGDRRASPAEGWAHVMDRTRCTALAVAGFGQDGGSDMIQTGADGTLTLDRQFPVGKGQKRLRFWLHFVSMPVQVGALTSPQAMQAPLLVEVGKPSD